MSVVPVAQRAQTSLAAGAHQKEGSNTFFNSGFVPRNVIKPGFKDTGMSADGRTTRTGLGLFATPRPFQPFLSSGIVAVRLHAKGGMAARYVYLSSRPP